MFALDIHDEHHKDEATDELEEEGRAVTIFIGIARSDDVTKLIDTDGAEWCDPCVWQLVVVAAFKVARHEHKPGPEHAEKPT